MAGYLEAQFMTDHPWWGEYEDYKAKREARRKAEREERRKMYEEQAAKYFAEAYWDGECFATDAEREQLKAFGAELRRKAEERSEARWENMERIGWTGDEREG